MDNLAFWILLGAGSLGVGLSFAQARSRAVLAEDGFAEPLRRLTAIGLLGITLLLTVALPFAAGLAGAEPDTKNLTVVSLFVVHFILLLFLLAYYSLSGWQSLGQFLKLRSRRPLADLGAGFLVGSLGWVLTVLALLAVVLAPRLVRPDGMDPSRAAIPPMIAWLASQPLFVKITIVLSAMVVEELFFRAFLQTRVGPVAATLMFTAAHAAYGQPMMLVGILVISTVLAAAFALYGNVLPCIVAHGVFDAIQLFVVIPIAQGALG